MTVEVYWFSEQPYGHVTEDDLAPYESVRMHFPNTHFDPAKAHVLYNNHEMSERTLVPSPLAGEG